MVSVEKLGVDQLRITHSVLEDYDATSIICYIYVVAENELDYTNPLNYTSLTIYDIDKREVGFFTVDLPAISAGQEYVVEIATLDAFGSALGATATGAIKKVNSLGTVYDSTWGNTFVENRDANIINISDPARLSLARGVYINNVIQVKPDSFSGSSPAYLDVYLSLDNPETTSISSVDIQLGTGYDGSTLSGIVWTSLFSGSFQNIITLDSGLVQGTDYVFKIITTFSDGSLSAAEYYDADVDTSAVEHPLVELTYDDTNITPADPTGVSFAAYTDWDGTPTYDLEVTWSWSDVKFIKQFEIQYVEFPAMTDATDPSTADWNSSLSISAGSGVRKTTISAFPPAKRFAFRVRAISWSSGSDKYSSWSYGKVYLGALGGITYDIVPSDSAPPSGTNIQVNKNYIRTYNNWNGTSGDVTFQVDASTGDVQIGKDSPLYFDASTNILTVDGTAVINTIVAASYEMDWLSGTAPSFRTSNKTGFDDGGSGVWMGYTDGTTFKMDMGSDTKYIRWNGADLEISGRVKILSDPDAEPGEIGYVTLQMSSSHTAVVFNDATDDPEEDTTITVNLTTNSGDVANWNWDVVRGDTDAAIGANLTKISDVEYTLDVTAANNVMASGYDNIKVRVYDTVPYSTAAVKGYLLISRLNRGETGSTGPTGPQGTRGPIFSPGSVSQDPTLDATWLSPTPITSPAGVVAVANGGGELVQYDVLTLRNSTDPSIVDTRMWDGSTWTTPNLLDGDMVVTGTLSANRIAGNSGFFNEIGVNTIYNHGADESDYKMKIDFAGGVIHIRG